MIRLFLLFSLVPLAELLLLIEVGERIGLGPTLLLIVATGVVGAALARREGLRSWLQIQGELAEGRLPAAELFHGLLILLAGAFLITPGLLTDLTGFLLLARPVRAGLIRFGRRRLRERMAAAGGSGVRFQQGFFWTSGPGPESGPRERPGRAADGNDVEVHVRRRSGSGGKGDEGNGGRVIEL